MTNSEIISDSFEDDFEKFCVAWNEKEERQKKYKYPRLIEFAENLKIIITESSIRNRNLVIAFLFFQVYILVTISTLSDLDMFLPGKGIILPIVGAEIPIEGFFFVVPLFFILYHFNILYNVSQYTRKLFIWDAINGGDNNDLLLPGFMLNTVIKFKKNKNLDTILLKVSISAILFILPISVLLLIQLKYSVFHNVSFTFLHSLIIILDTLLLSIYWCRITNCYEFNYFRHSLSERWAIIYNENNALRFLWKMIIIGIGEIPLALLLYISVVINNRINGIENLVYIFRLIFISSSILAVLTNYDKIKHNQFLSALKRFIRYAYLFYPFINKKNILLIIIFLPCFLFTQFLVSILKNIEGLDVLLKYFISLIPILYIIIQIKKSYADIKWSFKLCCILIIININAIISIIILSYLWGMLKSFLNGDEYFIRYLFNNMFVLLIVFAFFSIVLNLLQSFQDGKVGFSRSLFFKKSILKKIGNVFYYAKLVVIISILNFAIIIFIQNEDLLTRASHLTNNFFDLKKPLYNSDKILKVIIPYLNLRNKKIYKISEDVNQACVDYNISSINDIPIEAFECLDFSNKNYRLINLYKTKLSGANFEKSKMMFADMAYADFCGANFKNANLFKAFIFEADLTHAKLENSKLNKTVFRKSKLKNACLKSAKLQGADLSYVDLTNADLQSAILEGATLKGAILKGVNLKNAKLYKKDLAGAIYDSKDIEGVIFIDDKKDD